MTTAERRQATVTLSGRKPLSMWFRMGGAVALLAVLWGCPAGDEKETAAMAAFRQEIGETVQRLAPPLTLPLVRGDERAVQKALGTVCDTGAGRLPRKPVTCSMGVLNRDGLTVALSRAAGSPREAFDYSRYESVSKALKKGKTMPARLFGPNRSVSYVVMVPLRHQGKVVGLLGLVFSPQELNARWGLTEEEFLSLNFNRK